MNEKDRKEVASIVDRWGFHNVFMKFDDYKAFADIKDAKLRMLVTIYQTAAEALSEYVEPSCEANP